MRNHTTIYIEVDEEITSIIERIKKAPANEIALVVPRRSFLSQGIVNLRILKDQSEKIGKKLMLVTRDDLCRSLADKVGLNTGTKLDSKTLKETKIDTPLSQNRNKELSFSRNNHRLRDSVSQIAPKKKLEKSSVRLNEGNDIGMGVSIDGAVPSFVRSSKSANSREYPGERLGAIEKESFGERVLQREIKMKNFFQTLKKKRENKGKDNIKTPSNKREKLNLFRAGVFKRRKKPIRSKDLGLKRDVGIKSRISSHFEAKNINKVILLPKANINILGLFILVLLAVIVLVAIFILPKADVEIIPKKDLLTTNTEVKVSPNQGKIDFDNRVILGKEISEQVEETEEREASGEAISTASVSNKAQGTIVVYNEFSSSPETLIVKTRFVTDNDLVFRSISKINIPGYTKEGDKIIPGEKTIEVVADKEGEEYEAVNKRMTIPGLEGGERHDKIYALTEMPLKISNNSGNKAVTLADIKKANEEMNTTLERVAKEKILAYGSGFKVIEESIKLENPKTNADKIVGSRVDKFKVKGQITVRALAYKEDDLRKIADYVMAKKVGDGQRLLEPGTVQVISSQTIDKGSAMDMNIRIEKYSAKEINLNEIRDKILGSSEEIAREKLKISSKVEDVRVKCWPFWVKTIPSQESRVNLSVAY